MDKTSYNDRRLKHVLGLNFMLGAAIDTYSPFIISPMTEIRNKELKTDTCNIKEP